MVHSIAELQDKVMSFSIDQIRLFADMAAKEMPFYDPTDSPLEQVVAQGLFGWVVWYGAFATAYGYDGRGKFFKTSEPFEKLKLKNDLPALSVWQHVRVDQYTADFVIRYQAGTCEAVWVAVECDGHDFHERTKEQAAHDRARDRHFQTVGLSVLRFTGSEIWRDPVAVLCQVFDFIVARSRPAKAA